MVTRAPTYTAFTAEAFRMRGGSLSKKLHEEFLQVETFADGGMQVSACTLFGGAHYSTIFSWTNPIAPTPVYVDHLVIKISTAAGDAKSRMILGRTTLTGAGNNACSAANRAIANSYEGASRRDMVTGLPLGTATVFDSRTKASTSFQRAATFLAGAYQCLSSRAIAGKSTTLAGTIYVYWHKAFAGS